VKQTQIVKPVRAPRDTSLDLRSPGGRRLPF